MTRSFAIGMTTITLIGMVTASGIATAQQPAASGNAIIGQQLYFDFACYSCHGFNGETGARTLVDRFNGVLSTEAGFIRFLRLRADQNPILPSTRMPNYPEESLSDDEARHIYAFIRIFEDTAPAAADIPLFNQILEAASRSYEPSER